MVGMWTVLTVLLSGGRRSRAAFDMGVRQEMPDSQCWENSTHDRRRKSRLTSAHADTATTINYQWMTFHRSSKGDMPYSIMPSTQHRTRTENLKTNA
jgi:hypothetical protein